MYKHVNKYTYEILHRMWDDEIKQKKNPSLFRAVFKNYWLQMFMYSMICVIEVGILLYKVILYSLPPSLLARITHSLSSLLLLSISLCFPLYLPSSFPLPPFLHLYLPIFVRPSLLSSRIANRQNLTPLATRPSVTLYR